LSKAINWVERRARWLACLKVIANLPLVCDFRRTLGIACFVGKRRWRVLSPKACLRELFLINVYLTRDGPAFWRRRNGETWVKVCTVTTARARIARALRTTVAIAGWGL